MKGFSAFKHIMLLLGLVVLVLPNLADARSFVRGRQGGENVILVAEARGRRDRVPRVILFPQTLRESQRPPGWDRGRKVGWGNCDVPPGLAKKVGCRQGIFTGERRLPRRSPVIVIPLP